MHFGHHKSIRTFNSFMAEVPIISKPVFRPTTLLKKRLEHRCFPLNFAKIFKNTFFKNNLIRLLLVVVTFLLITSKLYIIHAFFNTHFHKQRQAVIGYKSSTSKQHIEAEHSLFKTYLLFSSTLTSKNNRRYSKKCTKTSASVLMTLYD